MYGPVHLIFRILAPLPDPVIRVSRFQHVPDRLPAAGIGDDDVSVGVTRLIGFSKSKVIKFAPETTRTSDLRFRKPLLYPPELLGPGHR